MTDLMADYHEFRDAFQALLQPECRNHILLFSGKSGIGKTTLLRACLADACADGCLTIPIDLRGGTVTLLEIFTRIGEHLGSKHLPTLAGRIEGFSAPERIQVDGNRLLGIGNQINVTVNAPLASCAALTNALFTDLDTYSDPLIIAFDTYNGASPSVKECLTGHFLARVARATGLRVVIAGQTVPPRNNIVWGHYCTHHELSGVHEANDWIPVINALGRYVPVPCVYSSLWTLCKALNGAPNEIMQFIENLPLKTNAI